MPVFSTFYILSGSLHGGCMVVERQTSQPPLGFVVGCAVFNVKTGFTDLSF